MKKLKKFEFYSLVYAVVNLDPAAIILHYGATNLYIDINTYNIQVWNIQIKNLEAQLFTPLFGVVKGLRSLHPRRGFAPAPHHGLRPWTPLLLWY